MTENFFQRWARRKAEAGDGPATEQAASASPAPVDSAEDRPPPTMNDVRLLAPDADFSRFMTKNVDRGVRRAALKTLFSDPHFQTLDRLDIYMDDYNLPSPMSPEMLAALSHAGRTLVHPARDTDGSRQDNAMPPGTATEPQVEMAAGPASAAAGGPVQATGTEPATDVRETPGPQAGAG